MTVFFNDERFQMKEFFSYPCVICDRIAEYEINGYHGIRGDKDVKDFFEKCLHTVEKMTNRKDLMENKIAIKVFDTVTGNTFYVGYKDNIYCIGLCLNPHINSCHTIKLDDNYVKRT